MDLNHVIEELINERNRLDALIRALEKGLSGVPSPKKPRSKRGRKSMDSEERKEVAARMKRYWANRKSSDANNQNGTGDPE